MKSKPERTADIQRTAEEIQTKFLLENARPDTPFKWRALVCAWACPTMTDRDFRQYVGHVLSSRRDGTESTRSHPTISVLTGCSVRASERSDAALKKSGWIDSRRRQRSPSSRSVKIAQPVLEILNALSFDNLEQPSVADQEVIPNPPSMAVVTNPEPTSVADQASLIRHPVRFENLDPPNTAFRSATHGGQTLDITSKKEREREDACAESVFSDSRAEGNSPVGLVKLNGTALLGPNASFAVPYLAIDRSSKAHGLDTAQGRYFAGGIAEGWAQNGDIPDDPAAKMHAALGSYAAALRASTADSGKPTFDLAPTENAPTAKKRTRRKAAESGTRLPEDFIVPEEWVQWAKETYGLRDGQLRYLRTNFVRYWSGPDAKNALKKDWKRTWQNNVEMKMGLGEIPSLPIPGSNGGAKVYKRPGR